MRHLAALTLAAVLATTAAQAQSVLFSTGNMVQANGTLISGANRVAAERFTLSYAATITQFDFSNWMVDATGASATDTPLTIDWIISDTGIGGIVLASGSAAALTVVAGTTSTFSVGGITTATQSQVSFDPGSLMLSAGDYWLELSHEASTPAISGSVSARWGGSDSGLSNAETYNGTTLFTSQPDHFLEVTGIPEPASLALLAGALATLGIARRRA